MKKHRGGGVSEIVCRDRASDVPAGSNDHVSATRKRKTVCDIFENEFTRFKKPLLHSVPGKILDGSRNFRMHNGEKVTDGTSNASSVAAAILGLKKKFKTESKSQTVKNDNGNQVTNVKMNKKFKALKLEGCRKDSCNSKEGMNIIEETSDNSQGMKAFKGRNEFYDGVDKTDFTIFVGNLPLSYDHKKVCKIFSKFGQVENARIRCVPMANATMGKKTSAITKKFHPNRNSAVAYVVFKSKESVYKAISQNGMILNGHHLRIDSAVSSKRDPKKCVFVGSLPFDIKDDELWDLFKDCGEIEDVRVVRDKNVSMGKGFGYINFKSSASVELALKLNGREIKNRKINVERCTQKKQVKNDITSQLLYKRPKKRQRERPQGMAPRKKSEKKSASNDFQGRIAEKKSRKKRRSLTKDAVRKNRIKNVFLPRSTAGEKGKVKRGGKS